MNHSVKVVAANGLKIKSDKNSKVYGIRVERHIAKAIEDKGFNISQYLKKCIAQISGLEDCPVCKKPLKK